MLMPFVIYGLSGRARSYNLFLRRKLLYPIELQRGFLEDPYRDWAVYMRGRKDGFQPSIKWCNGWGTIPQWRFLSLAYVYGGKSRTRTDTLRIMSSQYIHYTIFPVSVIATFLYPQPLLHVGVILSLRAPNCLPVNVKLTWQMQHSNS